MRSFVNYSKRVDKVELERKASPTPYEKRKKMEDETPIELEKALDKKEQEQEKEERKNLPRDTRDRRDKAWDAFSDKEEEKADQEREKEFAGLSEKEVEYKLKKMDSAYRKKTESQKLRDEREERRERKERFEKYFAEKERRLLEKKKTLEKQDMNRQKEKSCFFP